MNNNNNNNNNNNDIMLVPGQWKKGKWTPLEDQLLRDVVAEVGPDGVKDWFIVCKRIPNRSHKQCRGVDCNCKGV
jgi:hypothetical protein